MRQQVLRHPATAEVEYTQEELEFLMAMDAYKRTRGRFCPSLREVLAVLKSLGYRRTEPAALLPIFGGNQGGLH